MSIVSLVVKGKFGETSKSLKILWKWLWKLPPDLFISNYWVLGSISTLYITWGVFSLVCVLSIFFYFLSSFFFFFSRYFPWQTLTIRRDGRGNYYFSYFPHPLTNIQLIHRDFHLLFLLNLFVITRLRADETCSL